MHDADDRLRVFIEHMTREKVDFVLQLGDFCVPKEEKPWLPQGMEHLQGAPVSPFWGTMTRMTMDRVPPPGNGRWRIGRCRPGFIPLTGAGCTLSCSTATTRPADHKSGYPRFMASDQLEWLRKDLAATKKSTVIFVHQSPERPGRMADCRMAQLVRGILEQANRDAGFRKVVACFTGASSPRLRPSDQQHRLPADQQRLLLLGRRQLHPGALFQGG